MGRQRSVLLAVVVAVLLAAPAARAVPVPAVDFTGYGVFGSAEATLGWEFTTNLPVAVTHLGIYDLNQGGPSLEFFKAMPFTLQVCTENAFTRFGKRLGVVKDISAHDPEFDKRFFIRSDNARQAVSFLGRPEVRGAITAVFDKGFAALDFNTKRLYVRKANYAFPADVEAERVEELLRTLLSLLQSLG